MAQVNGGLSKMDETVLVKIVQKKQGLKEIPCEISSSVFYDIEIKTAFQKEINNSFEVSLDFTVKKQNSDSEDLLTINDLMEIGFYDKNDTLIELKQVFVKEIQNKLSFPLAKKPSKIVLDPNFLGIEKDVNALGYFGLSYYEENKDKLGVVGIDNGIGVVIPSIETVANNQYAPLSRSLFIFVNKKSAQRPEVEKFIKYHSYK